MERCLDLLDARDPRVERIWCALEAHSRPAYFLSWGWIENWIASLPAEEAPSLAVVHDGGAPTAAFFLAQRRVRRNLVVPTSALYLNATGAARYDELGIEHNGLVTAPGARRSLRAILDLVPAEWDEAYLPAIDRHAFEELGTSATPLGARYRVHIEREASAPYVDLDAVRMVPGGYEALAPPSTRAQLRRARRILGVLDVEIAVDARHARDIFGELLRLRARRWTSRGTFGDPWFEAFHRRLIERRLPHGEIQLARISKGGATLGCLYNLVHAGRVVSYQCGLAASDDPGLEPGTLCHAAAIEHNALAGHSTYDLVGGQAKHKESLATGASRLVWLRVRRPAARVSLESNVRCWQELTSRWRAAAARFACTPA